MGDSRQAFRELTDLDSENSRPVFLYFTSSDEKMTNKVEAYENAVLTNEKVCIAAKFFDCYQVDVTDMDESHPLQKLIKKPKPLTVYTIHKGKVLYKTKEKPSPSLIFSTCSRTLKKTYKVSLEKIAKKEEAILDELDKIRQEKEAIDKKRLDKGKRLTDREDAALAKREQELFEREMTLKEEEQKLLSLEKYMKEKDQEATTDS